ncbi:cytosolic protein [bacterium]|nr:cytosolic protein [bacterium]
MEDLFEDFLRFFFPDIYRDVDFSKGYQFLDNELQKIIKGSNTGKRIVDKLVKVYLADGSEKWLLIHIEIQGQEEKEFPERMYVYNYRLFDKFRRDIVSLALLTDDKPQFRPTEYRRGRWGFEVTCRFPVVKILDYKRRWTELEIDTSPFAIVVMSFLKATEIGGNVKEKYTWKKHFLLGLYNRGMTRETILAVYKFVDWIIELPEELDTEIFEEIQIIEETTQMPHITSAERIGMKRGMEKGIEKGIEKSIPALHQGIATIIEIRFGEAGRMLSDRAARLRNLDSLQKLMLELKNADDLSDAERIVDGLLSQA